MPCNFELWNFNGSLRIYAYGDFSTFSTPHTKSVHTEMQTILIDSLTTIPFAISKPLFSYVFANGVYIIQTPQSEWQHSRAVTLHLGSIKCNKDISGLAFVKHTHFASCNGHHLHAHFEMCLLS